MKKKRLMITLLLVISILLFAGFAYAYLASGVSNANRQEATITTGTMNLTFADGTTSLEATEMTIGTSVTKTFTVENTGTLDASASMYFEDLVNTYMEGSMTYRLEYSDSENGTYKLLKAESDMPRTRSSAYPISIPALISSIINVPAGEKLYYKLIITFNNLPDVDQTDDINAVLNTKFTMLPNTKYEYCFSDYGDEFTQTYCYDTFELCDTNKELHLTEGCHTQTKTNLESDYCFDTLDEFNTIQCYSSYDSCEEAHEYDHRTCFEKEANMAYCYDIGYGMACFDERSDCEYAAGTETNSSLCTYENIGRLGSKVSTEYCYYDWTEFEERCYETIDHCEENTPYDCYDKNTHLLEGQTVYFCHDGFSGNPQEEPVYCSHDLDTCNNYLNEVLTGGPNFDCYIYTLEEEVLANHGEIIMID